MKQIRKLALGAISACVVAMSPVAANAARVQLGFALDESGSINSTEWTIIKNGLASAINLIPVSGGQDDYYLSVITFDDNSTSVINNTLVTAANRASLATLVSNMVQGGGFTNYDAGLQGIDAAMGNSNLFDLSYVNFATDGDPNRCVATGNTSRTTAAAQACAVTARTSLIGSGVDNISIEGIGISAASATFLQNSICYPQPCDLTSPFNVPNQGFYIGVSNATQYAAAIGNKVRAITNQIPEPGTIALVGLALLGAGMARRKQA